MSPNPIYQYFNSNYGNVSYVSLHSQETHISAIVLFENVKSACDATLAVQHIINGHKVHIIPPVPNRVRSPPGLMDLNDDCLTAILGRLDLENLSIAAKTCGRLKELVQDIVSSQKNTVEVVVQSAAHLERCIKDIGPSICSLSLKASSAFAHNRVLIFLMKYCRDALTNLKLNGFVFESNDKAIGKSRVLFSRLQKLVLDGCSIPAEWFTRCPDLVEVELIETEIMFNWHTGLACPKLSTLKICAAFTIDHKGLQKFLQRNVQIKTLHIDDYNDAYYDELDDEYFDVEDIDTLNSAPPSIESLAISYPESSQLERFHELKELRLIRIRSPFDLVPVLDRNATSLEYFEFDERDWSLKLNWQNVDAISRLRKLKKLTIYVQKCERHHFQQMLKDLNELEDLRIGSHENPFDFGDVLRIIRNNSNLQHLNLSFRRNGCRSSSINRLRINAAMYRKMLELILLRTNGKPLHMVIIGPEKEISEIDTKFAVHSSLQITRFPIEFVVSVLDIDADENDEDDWYITITDKELKLLRSQ